MVDRRAGRAIGRMAQPAGAAHREPLVRREGSEHYEPIEWDEAFDLIGRELSSLLSPDGASFYTSGRCSNEAAFMYQLFARQFGTNNLPDCSNMCHESSGTALVESLGIGKGTVRLQDFEETELILIRRPEPGEQPIPGC
jgi:anaerobic selenocysteine-containing dehydrogenase